MSLREATKNRLAHVGLFYAAAIWGSTFFVVKDALAGVNPIVMVAYRFLIAGGMLTVYLLFTGRSLLEKPWRAVWLSVVLLVLYAAQTIGLGITTASNSGFITGLFVAFVPLFLTTIFRRKPTVMELTAVGVSLLGLWTLTGGLHDINNGDLLTLLAAVTYALHVLYADKYIKSGSDPIVITCQQFLLIGTMSFIIALIFDLPLAITSRSATLSVIFLALFPTFSAYLIQMSAQRFTSPVRVSLIFSLEPVFAGLFAWTLGGEQVVAHRALGGLLIFVALVISGLPTPSFLKRKTA